MNFAWDALRVFYADWQVVLQAVVAYIGITLYRALATISDSRQRPTQRFASIAVIVFFFGAFPLPARPFSGWMVLQHVASVGALVALGPVVLHGVLLDERGLGGGGRAVALRPLALALVYTPAAVVLAVILVDVGFVCPIFINDPTRGVGLADRLVMRDWMRAATTIVLYMLAAAPFALRTRRALRGVRLDATERWSAITAAAATSWGGLVIVTHLVFGPDSGVAQYARIGMYCLALAPGLVELRWAYDAVLRRVLAFHILLAFYAAVVLGGSTLLAALGLVSPIDWMVVLTAVAGSAQIIPQAVEERLECWLFPRAAARRARLTEIATGALPGSRAEAAGEVLRRVVEAIDCEGGIVVLQPMTADPAAATVVGRADCEPLGDTPAEAARYLATLDLGRRPHDVRTLPLAAHIRLASCDVTLVCPLVGTRLEGTLLLGPRRGWPYDEVTLEGLEVLGRNAGLALENRSLLDARLAAERTLAHREKLAALGEAAARIAHEIRNPLTAVRSLVQQAGRADGVAELTDPALGELDRIGRLVTDLLAFARPDDVRGRDAVDLVGVCRDGLAQVRALAAASAVTIETALPPSTLPVRGDHDRLVQVVGNLCRNAIEAMAETPAPRRLWLRCEGTDALVRLEVRDVGPGIPAELLPWLFEPFRTTKSAGTGLGLPIARQIVEAHGGRVVVESRPGVETTFRVELPLAAASAAA
jgi:signal transduction histidine kinase